MGRKTWGKGERRGVFSKLNSCLQRLGHLKQRDSMNQKRLIIQQPEKYLEPEQYLRTKGSRKTEVTVVTNYTSPPNFQVSLKGATVSGSFQYGIELGDS